MNQWGGQPSLSAYLLLLFLLLLPGLEKLEGDREEEEIGGEKLAEPERSGGGAEVGKPQVREQLLTGISRFGSALPSALVML